MGRSLPSFDRYRLVLQAQPGSQNNSALMLASPEAGPAAEIRWKEWTTGHAHMHTAHEGGRRRPRPAGKSPDSDREFLGLIKLGGYQHCATLSRLRRYIEAKNDAVVVGSGTAAHWAARTEERMKVKPLTQVQAGLGCAVSRAQSRRHSRNCKVAAKCAGEARLGASRWGGEG